MSDHLVDVYATAVAIKRGDSYLTIFHEKWGGFTFPMSKKRARYRTRGPAEETAEETAIRVVVEVLGRPLRPDERPRAHPVGPVECVVISGRDNQSKYYHFDLLEISVADDETPRPLGGVPVAWMTLAEIKTLVPVTVTAIYIAWEIAKATEG